ncbi:cytochrome P450 3A8-like isoform X2 [Bradysia coprophila]|uniref:cytochrome P450 3A8-like isoform X2 n=1 Tax=Bradysia coprophila TaxID=38358 RepID=UPI00187D741D|nr:cytochrome P450 3A8-like isoform X2 [Bradysia coprophila]
MLLLICLTLLAFISYGYWSFSKNYKYWKIRGVNGPIPFPIFGNLLDVLLTPRTILELKYYRKYGNLYGYYEGNKTVLVVGQPELIKTILVKDFHSLPQRYGSGTLHPVLKMNIADIVGDDWKRIRSIAAATFTAGKIRQMYPFVESCVNDFMVHLENIIQTTSNVNIRDFYGCLALEVIVLWAFAVRLNLQNGLDNQFVVHARRISESNSIKKFLVKLIPKLIFKTIGVTTEKNSSGKSRLYFVNLVRQMIKYRKEGEQKFNDFLQVLMDAEQSEGEKESELTNVRLSSPNKTLTEDEIIAQTVAFVVAGNETTASLLIYATYELAMNTDVQDKLFVEINSSFNTNGSIDFDELCRLPYLDAVISETLRHHSPVERTTRIVSQEYKLGDTDIILHPGQLVHIPIYAIHHDEKYYPDPFKFDPERFMPHNKHNLIPYTYLPFGQGPRNCLGARFGLLEAKLALARTVHKFTVFRCTETDEWLATDSNTLLNVPRRPIVGIAMRKK